MRVVRKGVATHTTLRGRQGCPVCQGSVNPSVTPVSVLQEQHCELESQSISNFRKKQIVITPDRVLQFTMAGSLDVRFAAVGLEVGATSGAKVTYSKGPMGPDKGNQPLVATLPGLYTLPLHRSFPWYLMRGTFQ
jgi:hypothetical protein